MLSPVFDISSRSKSGSMYDPAPNTHVTSGRKAAVGSCRKTTGWLGRSSTVWPALGPPVRTAIDANRSLHSQCATFPLPSDPYWPPIMTVTGI